jgi:uncharacterized protein
MACLISLRQTTFWDFLDREGISRVHFVRKAESYFARPEIPSFKIVDEHPLLLDYMTAWWDVFVSAPTQDSAVVVEEITRAVTSVTSGWRAASSYLNDRYAHAVMEDGSGLLLRAPLPVVEAAKSILERHSVRFSMLPCRAASGPPMQALVAGPNWVVANSFRVERRGQAAHGGRRNPTDRAGMNNNPPDTLTAREGAPETPLYLAAWTGDLDEAKALVAAGADVNYIDAAGETPIHGACAWGHAAMVKYLVSVGGKLDIPGTTGHTPLHWAAGWGNLETVRALIELGANHKTKNDFGQTAGDVATQHQREEVAAYLRALP